MNVPCGITIGLPLAWKRSKLFLLLISFSGNVCHGVFLACAKCFLFLFRILVSSSFFVSIVIFVGLSLTVLEVGSKYTVFPVAGSIIGVSLVISTFVKH